MDNVPEGQMTLEELYCIQKVQPVVEKLVSDTEFYREELPKSFTDVKIIVQTLGSHLDTLKEQLKELQYLHHLDED